MVKRDISITCTSCGGLGYETGKDPETEETIQIECPKCMASGFLVTAKIEEDLVGDIETIKDKVDWLKKNVKEILNHLDITEK